ncbi:MAG: sigma 54-interacting transcriptional regulator [Anaeromyxobacter sp.]
MITASPTATLRRRLDVVWERFVASGEIEGARPEIARSWRRVRELELDDGLPRAPSVAAPELARRTALDEVLWVARPVLGEAAERIRQKGSLVGWADPEGCVLWLDGDPDALDAAREINLGPGGTWGEAAAGTNGIGTAIADRAPVEVVASEHLVRAWQRWRTAGAPVLTPSVAGPVGIVVVAGGWDAPEPQGAPLAAALAAAISERLRTRAAVRDALVRHALRAARDAGDALVVLDARGALLHQNEAAGDALPLERAETPRGVRERLAAALSGPGQPADELVLDWPAASGDERHRVLASIEALDGRPLVVFVRVPRRAPGGPIAAAPLAATAARQRPVARYAFGNLAGRSDRLRAAITLAEGAAHNDLPVVLQGESGTGKELFAHGIHAASDRAAAPFVAVNCGAIPAPLVEAELFGYEPGTFTGGQKEGRAGKLEEAHGGTLFLDEVTELPLPAQTALLRVLQEGEVTRLGGSRPRRVEVRIVAATNRDLAAEVAAGRFRQDLFFRLSVLHLDVPPLRERAGDVSFLANVFLEEAARRVGRGPLTLSPAALEKLEAHGWPGNVRELKNAVMRAAAVAASEVIGADDLRLVDLRPPRPSVTAPAPATPPPGDVPGTDAEGGPGKDELVAALEACGWNIARTATTLGVSRMTLYRRLRRFGITR